MRERARDLGEGDKTEGQREIRWERERERGIEREMVLMIFCGTQAWRLVWCGNRYDGSFP
jgi:hypothetical protein